MARNQGGSRLDYRIVSDGAFCGVKSYAAALEGRMHVVESYYPEVGKKAISEAEGIDGNDEEKTYKGPAGGVVAVLSEMGEPTHKLATHGHGYTIKRRNEDFQKTWFGPNSMGEAMDLEDITYAEVLRRKIELVYVKHEFRGIDPSLKWLTKNLIRHIERFTYIED
ncbi:hypothetical protein HOY80DRAFT_1054816 [Tuber brumale]|nr:hypothetical protein HOY80DRAFT_1054816 [Tuber brumale]